MKQFLLTEMPDRDGLIRVCGGDYHYLVNVRRLKPGSTFTAAISNDTETLIQVLSVDRNTLTGKIIPKDPSWKYEEGRKISPPLPAPHIILFQAMPKEAKMDLIVRQAAEGGIAEIVPFIAERSIPKKNFRTERWRRIIKEARQQSGSSIDTRIQPPLAMDELFVHWDKLCSKTPSGSGNCALGMVFNLSCDGLEQAGFHHYLSKEPLLTVLAVGPEGGFSAAELDRFMEAGFKCINLGETVLRTETAALYGAAAVRIILMERKQWMIKQQ